MGTYLATGIVYKILIQKRDMGNNKFPIENIAKSLQKEINMDHYIFDENDDAISWEIKPEMLEGNFVDFLENQFKMYSDEKNIQKVISAVKEAQTGDKIIELAKQESHFNFQMVHLLDSLDVLRENGFSDHITVNYHLITFFMDGKIIMECYRNILHYFERVIRLQEEKYPVAGCFKTMITS